MSLSLSSCKPYSKFVVFKQILLILKAWLYGTGIKITDFLMPSRTSDTIKYLLDILKIHQTSCPVIL